jgi:hypothetical protein
MLCCCYQQRNVQSVPNAYVKKSLQEHGFAEFWINQSVLSPSYLKNIVKSRIKDQYV